MGLTVFGSVDDMVLFAAVVREGGFTAAATKAGMTKQAASLRIGRLEARLGVRLLERTTRRVRPTDAGARYYERCVAIAHQIEEANEEVRAQQGTPKGNLRVSAPMLYGRRFLSQIVGSYMSRYPDVRVEVILSDRRVNLVEEGFDLAIRIGQLGDSSLSARRIGTARVDFVASPKYLRKFGMPTLRTLSEARCIAMRSPETWNVLGRRFTLRPQLVLNDLELACHAASMGLGIAQVPEMVAREHLAKGTLQVLWPKDTLVMPIHVVFPSRAYLPPKSRLFIDTLTELSPPSG
jgi:DNA-binding transcriptional LysR family regulator